MTSNSCLFCKIAGGEIPADIRYQDERVVVFTDINPQAPTHLLVIPRQHISTLNELDDTEESLAGYMILTARRIAAEYNIAEKGFRLVMNCNGEGGQTVFHVHLHILGGRQMRRMG